MMASPHPLPSLHQAGAGGSGRQPASVVIVMMIDDAVDHYMHDDGDERTLLKM